MRHRHDSKDEHDGDHRRGAAMTDDAQRRKGMAFRALHDDGTFVMPNPWDVGSALALQAAGFPALATTSSGFAFTLGRDDGGASLDEVVGHARAVAAATEVPLSVDLEHGHGRAPQAAAEAVAKVADAGAVGGSIEDFDPDDNALYEPGFAAERVAAAADLARSLDLPFTLTARAENHIRGNPDLDDTIARLRAYEEAGADVLYAPGLRDSAEVARVCEAVSKPVNVLAFPGMTVAALAAAGARRISVGGALAWVALDALTTAAARIRDEGTFEPLAVGVRPSELLRD